MPQRDRLARPFVSQAGSEASHRTHFEMNGALDFTYSPAGPHLHRATNAELNDHPSTNQNPGQTSYYINYNEPGSGPPNINPQYISPVDDNWSQNGAGSATPSSAHPFHEPTSQSPFQITGGQHSPLAHWYPYPPQEGQQDMASAFTQPPPDEWTMQSGVSHPGSNAGQVSFASVHGTQGSNSGWGYLPSTSSGGYAPSLYQHSPSGIVPGIDPYSQGHTSSSSAGQSFNRVQNAGYTQPSPSQPTNPFYSFPIGDRSRVLIYNHASNHTKQTNNKLLGVESTSEYQEHASGSSYSAPVPTPTTPPSEPTPPEVLSEEDRKKLKSLEAGLPGNENLKREALLLYKEDWLISDKPEPPLETGADQNHANAPSRFDAFFNQEGHHACYWTVDGKKCPHTAPRRERALGHARCHFDYKPFHCDGGCGNPECTHKYHCQSALKDHVRRKGHPSSDCEVCGRTISVQNLRRHKKTHEPKRPKKLSRVTKILTSVGKAIKRTLSRSPSLEPPETQ